MTNILQAIKTIVNNPVTDLVGHYKGQSSINGVGGALEIFIKDAFADTINEENEQKRTEAYSEVFDYQGNQNNPPDIILKTGDAVEIKKIESLRTKIALNSSYPKSKLLPDNPMITKSCGEDWTEKDIIYTIGCVEKKQLKLLWLIYGNCYVAEKETYQRLKRTIANGITEITDVEFSETKELGRVNKVDPMGITYLRIRGMWGIENPLNVYSYIDIGYDSSAKFQLIAIIPENKYLEFPMASREELEKISMTGFKIASQKIKSPSNPSELVPAKLVKYKF